MSAGVCLGPQFASMFIGRRGFPCGSAGKESTCNARDLGLIPGLGRSRGEGKGYPLQYSSLENFMDRVVHGVAKSWTWLSDFHFMSLQWELVCCRSSGFKAVNISWWIHLWGEMFYQIRTPPLQPHLTVITFLKGPSLNSVTLRVRT